MVGIIDIGLGNIKSVTNWLDRCVIPWELIQKPVEKLSYDLVILPGVGSVKEFMKSLKENHFIDYLNLLVKNNQRILGICLGAQVMFDSSEEDGGVKCLGLIKGKITHIPIRGSNTGWLPFECDKRQLSRQWKKKKINITRRQLVRGRAFFNHNYGIELRDQAAIDIRIGLDSLLGYSALVNKDNLFACQFHPEKSQELGEELLKIIY